MENGAASANVEILCERVEHPQPPNAKCGSLRALRDEKRGDRGGVSASLSLLVRAVPDFNFRRRIAR
jgi:hypothetical protein